MEVIPFCLAYLMPISLPLGYWLGDGYSFLIPFFTFVVIPILDLFVGPDIANPTHEEMEVLAHTTSFRLVTILYVPIHIALVVWGAYVVSNKALPTIELIGLVLSIGITTGSIGITVAHELFHKRSKLEKALGKTLLMTVSYMHFYIEHLIDHHINVCTPRDPATARLGESFYAFYPRTIFYGFRNAWRIETQRLKKIGQSQWSYHNQMYWFVILPILFSSALGLVFGWKAVPYFFTQSVIAFSLLEIVNYLEHYGLVRKELSSGCYEKVTMFHAWNADHRITNYFLFKLQRHADHHIHPTRRYQTLRSFAEGPKLPTGYAGMVLLALIPPLWRRVMDPRVHKVRERMANQQNNDLAEKKIN